VVAKLGKQRVGVFRCGDVFGGEKGGQSALPALVLTFDFAFGLANFGARADAGTITQQVQQRIMALVAWEPTVRGRIQLPKSANFEALPATEGSRPVN
jgi:hypothetical protein